MEIDQMTDVEGYLSLGQVADVIGCSMGEVLRLIDAGKLIGYHRPAAKQRLGFQRADVEAYCDSKAAAPPTGP